MRACRFTCAPPAPRAADRLLARVGAALLFVVLEIGVLASGGGAARSAPKERDTVRTTADQMHQLDIGNPAATDSDTIDRVECLSNAAK